jgi:hypothetical protein
MDQIVLHAKEHILELVMTIIFTVPKGSIPTNNLTIWSFDKHTECNVYDPIGPSRQLCYCPRDIRLSLLSSTVWIAA